MPASLESNILHDLHLTEKEYMGFYSWVYWPSAVTSLLSGFLIDRILGVRLGIGIFSWLVSVGQVYTICISHAIIAWNYLALILRMLAREPPSMFSLMNDSIANTPRPFLSSGAYGLWRPSIVMRTHIQSSASSPNRSLESGC